MRIIVTHHSPDWDAITSCWLLKRFLPGWENAQLRFVSAGERLRGSFRAGPSSAPPLAGSPIEQIGDNEVIHVDTGLGPLDHHETNNQSVCAASRTWSFVKSQISNPKFQSEKWRDKEKAIERIVAIVTDVDHFREVFWENPTADYHEFSLLGLLEGYKLQYPDQDEEAMLFGFICLDAMLRNVENRVWAEKEIEEKGIPFETRFGKGLGIETINDAVLKLAQKMGYAIVVRKDPRKGYVRIKARPGLKVPEDRSLKVKGRKDREIDLTSIYEILKKRDPKATWFLHVSKKMLLNGTSKNPSMIPSILTLQELIEVVQKI